MADDLIGIPNGGERFHVSDRNENYVVYNIADAVPEIEEPLYIGYRVYGSDERERLTNSSEGWDDVAISEDEWRAMGVVEVGYSEELTPDLPEHPWRQFEKNLEQEAQLRPWLMDEEFLEISSQAYLEGREVTEAEMKTTDWWQSTSQREREWAELVNSDPEEAERQLGDVQQQIQRDLERRGWQTDERNDPSRLANYWAKQLISGQITESELDYYLDYETDPYLEVGSSGGGGVSTGSRLAGLYVQPGEEVIQYGNETFLRDSEGNYWKAEDERQAARLGDPDQVYEDSLEDKGIEPSGRIVDYFEQREGGQKDTGLGNVENVKREFYRWLGPHAQDVSDDTVGEWAHKIRRNENAADELTEYLRGQRVSLFPNHENPNLTWQDISEPWRQTYRQFAGQPPEENDKFFRDLVQMNDYTEAERRLREKGLEEGWQPVTSEFLNDATQALGGTHRPAAPMRTRQANINRR